MADIAARIADVLQRDFPLAYCDSCLALELHASLQETRAGALQLAPGSTFTRSTRVCHRCKRVVELTALTGA